MNEELEKLKKSADLSQNLLIEKVEDLVRSEYDRDLIEKEIRSDLKQRISGGINKHIKNIAEELTDILKIL